MVIKLRTWLCLEIRMQDDGRALMLLIDPLK